MKADKQFDFYEFAGIVMPGAILIAGLAQLIPAVGSVITVKDISLGSLGLFLILAYAAGHLVQSIGNFLEFAWWWYPGMPTDWVRSDRGHLLSPSQRSALEQQLPKKLALEGSFSFSAVSAKQWFAVSRQVYAAVAAATRSSRVDTFNGNYGLNRGLAAAFLVLGIVTLIQSRANWPYALGLAIAAALALFRMHRFGRHYARELFVQFLQLPMPENADEKKHLILDASASG
jgi:hypothetical protein